MKKCLSCGTPNRDENCFCSTCGGNSFAPSENVAVQHTHTCSKSPFTGFDLMAVLGFVSSLVGLFQISLILEPIGAITSIVGFIKCQRSKGLAAAGFIISVIGLIIRLFTTLYNNNLIPKWLITGALD